MIQQHLKTLKLPAMRREYGQLARQARADSWSYEEYLRELLDIEIHAREASTTARRLREARFPDLKTLGQIDWDAMAGVSKQQILELASCQFIERPEDVGGDPRVERRNRLSCSGRVRRPRCHR